MRTYDLIQPKQILPFRCQVHVADRYLPPFIAAPDFYPERAPDDLMSKADTQYSDAVMRNRLLCELDQFQDPGEILE